MNCKKHTKHARKRPKNREVSEQNKHWEADIKFTIDRKRRIRTDDRYNRCGRAIVWTHLGEKSKSKNFIEWIDRAMKYWEVDRKELTIKTDNGSQFKSKATEAYISPFTKR